MGRFYMPISREGSYLIYVTCDREKTPGVDYVPERWYTWLSPDSISSRQFVLKKGASLYLEGELRYIETNKVATSYEFTVLELKESGEKSSWTGPVREYGSYTDLVRFLGFDTRLVVVPADTEVKIQIKAYFPGKQSQTFILTGRTGYFKLSQGETLHIDVREQNIISNMEYVKGILSSGFFLLDECQIAGFLVNVERNDLSNAYGAVRESLTLLKKGFFDQSFAKLRSAYILATRTKSTLEELIRSSSQSLIPLLLLFLFVSSASAHLIMEKSIGLEVTARNGRVSISATSILEMALYFLFFILIYLVFPGSHLVPQLIYISMGLIIFLVGKIILVLFPRFVHKEESENRSIQFKSAIVVAFLMASRNLRRRKMRSLINLISVMILIFGFITLTSISSRYGLSTITLKPILPCLLYTSPSPRDLSTSRMPSSA